MKSLLILDDSDDIMFVLGEFLKSKYEIIGKTHTIAQAEEALIQHPFTHLIVDYRIERKALELMLLQRWRVTYPNIEYIAIFTGLHLDRRLWPNGCDELFQKPEDLRRLLRMMCEMAAR